MDTETREAFAEVNEQLHNVTQALQLLAQLVIDATTEVTDAEEDDPLQTFTPQGPGN